jgi:cystathionine gamma-lyase
VTRPTPVLWLIGGPNGAGKTTITRTLPVSTLLKQLRSLNPDEVSKEWLRQRHGLTFRTAPAELLKATFIEAADFVFSEAQEALRAGEAICLETVLSTDKYRSLVELALQLKGYVGLIYVAVASPEISARRIANRVRGGGHDVPTEKLEARWQRSLEQLPWFISRAKFAAVYDNSDENPRSAPALIALKARGLIKVPLPERIPELAASIYRTHEHDPVVVSDDEDSDERRLQAAKNLIEWTNDPAFWNEIAHEAETENEHDLALMLKSRAENNRTMSSDSNKHHFRTRAIHVGQERDPQTGAVVPPIHVASTFVQPGAGVWGQFDYSRSGNPTRAAFEATIANLEGGVGGLAFASGMAATHCATMLLDSGDHLLAGGDIYGGTFRLLHKVINHFGVSVSLAPSTDLAKFEAAIKPNTKLIWIESPGNPLMSITDIAAIAEIAHKHGALLGVDNTFATPVLTRPLELGADIVMHSATKYIGGHSDLLGGALVVREKALRDKLYFFQNATGGVMGPFECFLASRGLKTLELRVREQSKTALRLAQWLDEDTRIGRVLYPGLTDHPGHAIAAQQMDGGFGAMLTFETKGDFQKTKRVCESTKLFQLAVSLGAVESLIEQPASMSHASYDPAARAAHGISDGLIRLSVGLEAFEDLRDDLDQALKA